MKHTTSRSGWLGWLLSACCAGCLLFTVAATVTGCGPEKQNVTAPDTSGAPPGGGNVTEYKENMKRIQQQGRGGGPGSGGPRGGGPGGPPPGFGGGGR